MATLQPPRAVRMFAADARPALDALWARVAQWPWREVALPSLLAWVVSRLMLMVASIAILLLDRQQDQRTSLTLHTIIHTWNRFDTPWFLFIAHYGYTQAIATVYFPLYPGLIHAGMAVFGAQHDFIIGLAVSNLSLLIALVGLALLARMEGISPRLAQSVLLAYPLAYFLAAAYTESVFLACAVWLFVCARRGFWFAAAACAALGMATRVTGAILWLPLLWEFFGSFWWRAAGSWTWRRVAQAVAVVGSIPATLGAYMLYCWSTFHDPLSFVHGETAWTHKFLWPWEIVSVAQDQWSQVPMLSYEQARVLLDVGPWFLCVALTVALAWSGARRSEVWYMLALLVVCVASPLVQPNFPYLFVSAGRYCVVAFPLWLMLAKWLNRWPWLETLVIQGGFVLQAVFLSVFLRGGWIA